MTARRQLGTPNPRDERELERAADRALAEWRKGEALTPLDLRAACHAAERASDADAERRIAAQIADLEEIRGSG